MAMNVTQNSQISQKKGKIEQHTSWQQYQDRKNKTTSRLTKNSMNT